MFYRTNVTSTLTSCELSGVFDPDRKNLVLTTEYPSADHTKDTHQQALVIYSVTQTTLC